MISNCQYDTEWEEAESIFLQIRIKASTSSVTTFSQHGTGSIYNGNQGD